LSAFPDLFDPPNAQAAIRRVRQLTATSQPVWGRMSVGQMLAHLCVAYDMAFTDRHPRPSPFVRLLLRWFVKPGVVGPRPYRRNTPTAPVFRITDARDFEAERDRLVRYLERVAAEGRARFEGRESPSFGPLTATEWNVLFAKHLDHHLRQFGV